MTSGAAVESSIWGLPARHGGTPLSLVGLFQGQSQSKMDDDWGYPYFRKPPYTESYIYYLAKYSIIFDCVYSVNT